MGKRRKIVTTVSIDPDAFEVGRDEGYNFSQLLERAIFEKNNPRKELLLIQRDMREKRKELRALEAEADLLEKLINKQQEENLERAFEKYMPQYIRLGSLVDRVLVNLEQDLGMSKSDILVAFENRKVGI